MLIAPTENIENFIKNGTTLASTAAAAFYVAADPRKAKPCNCYRPAREISFAILDSLRTVQLVDAVEMAFKFLVTELPMQAL